MVPWSFETNFTHHRNKFNMDPWVVPWSLRLFSLNMEIVESSEKAYDVQVEMKSKFKPIVLQDIVSRLFEA